MRNVSAAAVATLVLLSAPGCVSSGKYKAKAQAADYYQRNLAAELQKTADLTKAAQDKDARIALLDNQLELLRGKIEALGGTLSASERALAAQDAALAARNAMLADKERQLALKDEELAKRSAEYDQLAASLKAEIEAGKIELSELQGRMTVKLKDKILFASGSATLGREGRGALAKVAAAFKDLKDRVVRVEGHTDDRPIGKAGFDTNWELSAARSLAVVRFLQDQGVDPAKLAGAAYSQYRPVAANDTAEGRSQNRRIEIVLATP
jgi:chemotaxis protein MotB